MIRFDKNFVDTLRNRVSIVEVVGQDVVLRPKGRGEFLGLCPFHGEKTPSFTVSENKGFYHCFGCGAHGDAIRFLTENSGYSYPEAIKTLASQVGMEIPKPTEYDQKKQKVVDDSYEVMELACKWFEKNLKSDSGIYAREYLNKRGLNKETIDKFRIGYVAEEWEGLKKALAKEGVSESLMIENGLITESQNSNKKYDRFRGRIIFPIFDYSGKVIAFGGRIIEEKENSPKYLNSPETPIFKKGYVLFGYNFARDEAYKKDQVIIVEGYMDVIALNQAGITNVVAPLGTAVTENHIKQIWKMCKKPVFCLDGDKAGIRASKRSAEEYISMIQPGYTMQFCFLTGGKDPDEVIKSSGVKNFRSQIDNSESLSDMLWRLNIKDKELKTPEDKASLANDLYQIIGGIENQTVREFYRKDYNSRLYKLGISSSKQDGGKKGKTFQINNGESGILSDELRKFSNDVKKLDEQDKLKLFLLVCYNPWLLNDGEIDEIIKNIEFSNKNLEKLIDLVIDFTFANDVDRVELEGFYNYLEDSSELSQLEFLRNNPLRIELSFKNNKQNAVTTWHYLVSEYNLKIAQQELKELSSDENLDEKFRTGTQEEVIKLQEIRDLKREELENLLEDGLM